MSVMTSDWRELESFTFGGGEDAVLADSLLALVIAGKKTATCWPVADGQITEVGKRMLALDSAGRPRVVLETVELFQSRCDAVDWSFAKDEGENDDLEGWRRDHRAWLSGRGDFSPEMMLWCERFKLIETLAPDAASTAPQDDKHD
jgi:uncharacterized protein YhfF